MRRTAYALGGATAVVVAGAVVVAVSPTGGEQPSARPAASVAPGGEADLAANWLVRQLTRGTVRDQERDVEDLGQAIDIALAVDELGDRRAAVAAVAGAVAAERREFTRDDGELLPGPAAQALYLLQSQGEDAGGLRGDLEAAASTDPLFPGRLRGSTRDTLPEVVGQAYAARSLVDSASPRAADVASFLLDQQCTAGWFRVGFAALDAPDQTCDGGAGSRPDADVTALVLLLLGPVADEVEGGEGAMERAARWLVTEQTDSGLVPGGESGRPNAVTTGLAARALGAWGSTAAAARAAEALVPLQLTTGIDAGAVAYDEPDLAVGRASGLGVPPPDRWRRATTQAAPALRWLDPGSAGQDG
ncbi:hypothetical protein GCM10009737_27100 [Nocardioides lentus]|uniref:Terpene cyclase/mutase family protein n=1 Tax=Nocardioides lentus TaxID=338077 RepID=A0ABN2PNI3_9ACTN